MHVTLQTCADGVHGTAEAGQRCIKMDSQECTDVAGPRGRTGWCETVGKQRLLYALSVCVLFFFKVKLHVLCDVLLVSVFVCILVYMIQLVRGTYYQASRLSHVMYRSHKAVLDNSCLTLVACSDRSFFCSYYACDDNGACICVHVHTN